MNNRWSTVIYFYWFVALAAIGDQKSNCKYYPENSEATILTFCIKIQAVDCRSYSKAVPSLSYPIHAVPYFWTVTLVTTEK